MKSLLSLSIFTCIFLLSCKKNSPGDKDDNSNSPKAGSTWTYKIKEINSGGTDSTYMQWLARDTVISGKKWLAIFKQAGSSPTFFPFFAVSPNNGNREVLSFNATGEDGLWLSHEVISGGHFLMHNPIGWDYGFSYTNGGKLMAVTSTTNIFNENGVSYNSLTYAANTEITSSGSITESIKYQTYGPLLIEHTLDRYITATDSHEITRWTLVSFHE